jgi:hypothetical protein
MTALLLRGQSTAVTPAIRLTNRMDEAFCLRMRWAIAAGLENAPTGVITTPGTKNPKYVAPLVSSQRDVEHT